MNKLTGALSLVLLSVSFVLAQLPQVTINDDFISAADPNKTLTADTEWILQGLVYIEDGATLTIEPGTIIKGEQTVGSSTSALIVARGGTLIADGTADKPIIFTSVTDDLSDPSDLTPDNSGEWGGIIVLGYATINTTTGVGNIEGIDPGDPRSLYGGGDQVGGPDDADNSGTLRYISIRHGGFQLGIANEINGLTLGGVGSGTIVENIEVMSNLDDGFEWFGGTVNTKFLASVFNRDDSYDWDEGFRGNHQYWFAIQNPLEAGRTAEQDGGTSPEDGQPFATPVISNATYIGPGANAVVPVGDGDAMLKFRDNTGGYYYNSIFTEFNGPSDGEAVDIEDLAAGEDSRERVNDNELEISNNVFFNFGNGSTFADITNAAFTDSLLSADGNTIEDPQINSLGWTFDGSLDPGIPGTSPAASGADFSAGVLGDPHFDNTAYRGAFDNSAANWLGDWSGAAQEFLLETSFDQSVLGEWDLVGLPLDPAGGDDTPAGLFPGNDAFVRWDGSSYVNVTNLQAGEGYWNNFTSAGAQTLTRVGAPVYAFAYDLAPGWSIISPPSADIPAAGLIDPSSAVGTQVGWNGSAYVTPTTYEQGKGYWFNNISTDTVTVYLSNGYDGALPKTAANTVSGNELEVADAAGTSQTLYFNAKAANERAEYAYLMPPKPPIGAFDVRFATDSRISKTADGLIELQVSQLPITVSAPKGESFIVRTVLANGQEGQEYRIAANEAVIADPAVRALYVTATSEVSTPVGVATVPDKFVVEQNYPNPFNPTTTIRYALPQGANVEVVIYNSLGQQVKSLVSEYQDAGYHNVNWDATDVNGQRVVSGIYYFSVTAGEFAATNKMVLLK